MSKKEDWENLSEQWSKSVDKVLSLEFKLLITDDNSLREELENAKKEKNELDSFLTSKWEKELKELDNEILALNFKIDEFKVNVELEKGNLCQGITMN